MTTHIALILGRPITITAHESQTWLGMVDIEIDQQRLKMRDLAAMHSRAQAPEIRTQFRDSLQVTVGEPSCLKGLVSVMYNRSSSGWVTLAAVVAAFFISLTIKGFFVLKNEYARQDQENAFRNAYRGKVDVYTALTDAIDHTIDMDAVQLIDWAREVNRYLTTRQGLGRAPIALIQQLNAICRLQKQERPSAVPAADDSSPLLGRRRLRGDSEGDEFFAKMRRDQLECRRLADNLRDGYDSDGNLLDGYDSNGDIDPL